MVFHEITKEAIDEALSSPRDIDYGLGQSCRKHGGSLDRLYGYEVSPSLVAKSAAGSRRAECRAWRCG